MADHDSLTDIEMDEIRTHLIRACAPIGIHLISPHQLLAITMLSGVQYAACAVICLVVAEVVGHSSVQLL